MPQSVIGYAVDLVKGEVLPFHSHQRAQLIYASRGVMAVTTRSASNIVPPQRAVWMPAGVEHRIEARSIANMRTIYIAPGETTRLPDHVCVLQIRPLLRELIIEAVAGEEDYQPHSPQANIMAVILDQIHAQPVATTLTLPLPTDTRLLRIVNALIDDPANQSELADWANIVRGPVRAPWFGNFRCKPG